MISLDLARCKDFKWDGEKVEPAGKEPHTTAVFVASAIQEIILYCLLYGWEHERERKVALKQLRKLHGRKPELFTVNFVVDAWNRLWFEFAETVREGSGLF